MIKHNTKDFSVTITTKTVISYDTKSISVSYDGSTEHANIYVHPFEGDVMMGKIQSDRVTITKEEIKLLKDMLEGLLSNI